MKTQIFVTSYDRLGSIFGISRNMVSVHAGKPDSPKKGKRGHSVAAWKKFLADQPKRYGADDGSAEFDNTLAGLKRKKLDREIREKDLKIGKIRSELIEIDKVRTWAGRWQSAVELIFSRMKSEFIPRVCGMEIAEGRKAFDKYVAAEFDRLRDSSTEWDQ